MLADADHRVGHAIDANLLAQRIALPQHVIHNVGTHNGHMRRVRIFHLGECAPRRDIQI